MTEHLLCDGTQPKPHAQVGSNWCHMCGRNFAPRVTKEDLLNLPEWYQPISNSSGSCPWCESTREWGHSADCARKVVLEILQTALTS